MGLASDSEMAVDRVLAYLYTAVHFSYISAPIKVTKNTALYAIISL